MHADIKKMAKQLDPGSISAVVCAQEIGPGPSWPYTYIIAISGDRSDEVLARLMPMGLTEDPDQSDAGDVSLYTTGRRIRAEVRFYSAAQKQMTLVNGGVCKIPKTGLTDIELSG